MATIPSPTTFTVGQKLTAALMNSNVRDAVNFFVSSPLCVLTNSATQSIANATVTAILFDTESIDSDNMHSTVTNTSRITAVTAGWYLISGNVPWTPNNTGVRWQAFQVNGLAASRVALQEVQAVTTASTDTATAASVPLFLNVGDYVEMVATQSSGGVLNTETALGGVRLSALWVHS